MPCRGGGHGTGQPGNGHALSVQTSHQDQFLSQFRSKNEDIAVGGRDVKVAVFGAAFAIPGTGTAMAAGPVSSNCRGGSTVGTSGNPGTPGNPRTPGTPGTPGTSASAGGTTSTSGGSAETTSASSVGSSGGGLLPTTGADLAGMLVAGLGAIGAGAVSMVAIRRRVARRN